MSGIAPPTWLCNVPNPRPSLNGGQDDEQTDFPIVYASAINRVAGDEPDAIEEDMKPLLAQALLVACRSLLSLSYYRGDSRVYPRLARL